MDPERPFRVWVEREAIRRGGLEIGNPNYLEEQILEPLRVVADRIVNRLGYRIFDPGDLLPSASSEPNIQVVRLYDLAPREDNPWDLNCAPATHPPMSAAPVIGVVFLNDHFFDPAITCRPFERIRTGRTIVHELAHVFGMKHAASTGDANSPAAGFT